MITIKDVARHAGVSTATVSRVLRNIGYIEKSTRERVMQSAAELGYVANANAQQLKKSTQKSVGFIIADVENEYYMGILSSIRTMLENLGLNLLVMFSSENPKDEQESFVSLIASRVSAILFTPTCNTNGQIIEIAQKNGIKVIQLFRDIYENLNTIVNDDEFGCYCAAKHLFDCGCRRILMAGFKFSYLDIETVKPDKVKGFMRAVTETGYAGEYKICHYPLLGSSILELTEDIAEFRPDGIITGNSSLGLAVMTCLKMRNLSAKVVSFDDNDWMEYCGVPAVKQNLKMLTDAICDIITAPDGTVKKKIIPQTLIER